MAITKTEQEKISKKRALVKNVDLTKEEKEYIDFFEARRGELQEARTDVFGTNLEEIWRDADQAYVPEKMATGGKKVYYTDDEKGWRGPSTVIPGSDSWRFNAKYPNPYIKIQTALAILVDRNPSGVFLPSSKKFEKTTKLMKQLHE